MTRGLLDWLHALLRRAGVDCKRYTPANDPHLRRQRLIETLAIDGVLDGGAHRGEYASRLRAHGYAGPIVSVEPQAGAFTELAARAARDPAWVCRRAALHARPGKGVLHVAHSTPASSLLPPTAALLHAIPDAASARTETVDLTTVDDVLASTLPGCHRVLLKLDVQGSELAALQGASASLARVMLVEAELPLQPLYQGAASFAEVHAWLHEHGFTWVGLAPNSVQRDGVVLEVDAVFACARQACRALT